MVDEWRLESKVSAAIKQNDEEHRTGRKKSLADIASNRQGPNHLQHYHSLDASDT